MSTPPAFICKGRLVSDRTQGGMIERAAHVLGFATALMNRSQRSSPALEGPLLCLSGPSKSSDA